MSATKTKLPKDALVSEILDAASKARSKAKKVEILQEFDSPALRAVLIWNFDDSARSMLPEGDVPYSPNEAPKGTDHNRLTSEYKNLYHFVKGGNDTLAPLRRESMFIQLLERLHAEEAEVICLTKDKNLTQKYKLTRDVVADAFPDIAWGWRS
jgi:hypothetical protein